MDNQKYTENGIVVPDIIDRLMDIYHADAADAADEIERLRKEVDLKGVRLDDALAEIERLREIVEFFLPHVRIVEYPAGLCAWIGDDECWSDPPDALVSEVHSRDLLRKKDCRG